MLRVTVAVLVVVGPLGIAAGEDPFAQAKIELANVEIGILTKAAEAYKLKNGSFPDKLQVLLDQGYVTPRPGEKKLVDPWGNEYHYDAKGPKNAGKAPDIWAIAPDKTEYGNWPKKAK